MEYQTLKYQLIVSIAFFLICSAPLSSQPTLSDTTIVLSSENILFATDSFSLDSISIKKLNSIFINDTIFNYFLEGHTDADGALDYNLKLSESRVLSVSYYLIDSLGLDSSRIVTSFKGELQPIASNTNIEGKSKNRRVTIKRILPLRLRYISGIITSNNSQPINNGRIYLQSRYYRDSINTDSLGRFKIAAPDNSFIRINATANDHFYVDTLLRVTPKLGAEPFSMSIPYLQENQRYKLPELFFVGDQDVVLFRSLSSLSALTRTMLNSSVCAIIEGHVNRPNVKPQIPGTFSYNLSVARARKIRNHLIKNGVDSLRINPIGFSNWYMNYPYAKTERDQELNRRVEMVIKNCDRLFEFGQEDLIIPEKIGTTKRLININ